MTSSIKLPSRTLAISVLLLLMPFAAVGLQHSSLPEPGKSQVPATGVLEGFVRLSDKSLPAPTRVRNTTDPEVCGLEHNLEDLLVSVGTRGVQNVIATLVGVPGNRVPATAPQRFVIDNRDCRFIPHVVVARVGDTVVAKNSDFILHNTHYYGPLASNIALPFKGMAVSRVLRRSGLVTVLCDVHGWMRAVIRVNDHSLHTVSDELGFLRISGIPAGSHTLELWHEILGIQRIEVEIRQDATTLLDFEFALTH